MTKSDFLKECISDVSSALGRVVPINDFNQAFCIVCINKECARSRSNNLLFEQRAINWQTTLFRDIPRASENDPRYADIRSKKFEPISPELNIAAPPEPDNIPENTFDKTKIIQQKMGIEFKSEEPEPESEPEPTPELELDKPTPPPVPVKPDPPPPTQPDTGNTPFTQGTMLSGKKKEIVLEPGQSYTFGSDDETS